jgi:hypothetical protein
LYATGYSAVGESFTSNFSSPINFVSVSLSKHNNPVGYFTVGIWNATGTYGQTSCLPDTLLCRSLNTLDVASVSTTPLDYIFSFSGINFVKNNVYFIIVNFTATVSDQFTNYACVYGTTNNGYGGDCAVYSTFWGSLDSANFDCRFLVVGDVSSYVFQGKISGGIFTSPATIAYAPTEITLQQNTAYVYYGSIYNNTVLGGVGNYSVSFSDYSLIDNIFDSYSFTSVSYGNITGGTFSFDILPVNTNNPNAVYQVMSINFNLTNGISGSYIYDFGFYGIGGQGDIGVPYPSPVGGSGGNGSSGGIFSLLGISNSELAVGIYAVCIIGLIVAFYYLHNSNVPFAFCLGLILATIICQIVDILGIYTYPIDVLITISVVGIIIFMRH